MKKNYGIPLIMRLSIILIVVFSLNLSATSKTVFDLNPFVEEGEKVDANNFNVLSLNDDLRSQSELQQNTVKGTIKDEKGNPIIGVTVAVKGTNRGTMSDLNGNFTLSDINPKSILAFSFVGYKAQEIVVGNKIQINIILQEETVGLNEVVIIGYGKQSRESVTTSISKLDTKILQNVPFANAISSLQGALSGVRVQSLSGQPGATPRVIIRGGTSINNPNGATPMYIIDGIVRSNMTDVSTDDIESIQVLKDAAATSIYGSRGSNGVIIVETKSGKAGKTKITYKYDLTVSNIGKLYKMAKAKDFITLMRLGMKAQPKFPDASARLGMAVGCGTGNDLTNNTAFSTQYLTEQNKYKLDEGWQSMPDPLDSTKTLIFSDTDFQALLYRTGISHNNYLEVSGGSEKVTFNAGLGYLTNEGTLVTTSYKRLTYNMNGTIKATDNLSFSGRILFSNSTIIPSPFTDTYTFQRFTAFPPTGKVYFEDGTLSPGGAYNLGNPLYLMNIQKRNNLNNSLTISFGSDWKILPGLSFKPQISMYNVSTDDWSFLPAYWDGPTNYNVTRTATASNSRWRQYQADATLNYVKSFSSVHNLDIVAGFSYYGRNSSSLSSSGRGASTDLIVTLNASSTPVTISSSITDQVILGYFSRVNYDYNKKYLLSINGRYDGASNLGVAHKWGFFPGVSVGWNVHKEDFWSFLPSNLLTLKLRGSYGVNGNISGLGDFTSEGTYSVSSKYYGLAAIINTGMPNKDLQWEKSKTFDIGADIGLFRGDRVRILFDYFRRVTDNLIASLSLPPSSGFTSTLTNLGTLENIGYEFEMSADVMPASNDFQWKVSLNASKIMNKILKLPYNGVENNRVGGTYCWDPEKGAYAWRGGLQEGGTMGDLYDYKVIGVYPTDADALKAPYDSRVTLVDKTQYGGDCIWLDVDKNDTINTRDQLYKGNTYPTWTGGFSSTFSYKGFDLYLRFDFTTGHTILNRNKRYFDINSQGDFNMTQDRVDNSWLKQGDVAKYPRYYWANRQGGEYYEPGDFLAIREATLSYNIPSKFLQKIKLSNLRLNVTGNNLYYFTKYRGTNPEDGGIDDGRYALPRNLIFSVNVSF